ncbi:MAG: hypothetical protein PHD95_05725 [Candidatus ainarchaeum sp.]|nr:hypothetical protein [Candidatus ainarchaeum sp.]
MGFFSKTIGRLASILLDLDDTQQPKEQIAVLGDFLAKYKFEIDASSMDEFLGLLKKKHFVDSITVSKAGEVIASSEGNGIGESFASAALIEFIGKQLEDPETILMKMSDCWFMIFPFNQNIYIVKAGTNLSTIELRALAREIDVFLKKEKTNRAKINGAAKKIPN